MGTPGRPFIKKYRLDLDVRVTATEIRIYADEAGKFQVPPELKGEVTYGESIKAIAAFLYSEGVVANDRICTFLNSLSGNSLDISEGSIYHFCRSFSDRCSQACRVIEEDILNSAEICTDATTVGMDGKQAYIRNFSTEKSVLYCGSEKKDLDALGSFAILKKYTGILIHDHETALYHFGTEHGECNVHPVRYLRKNTEETSNSWSHDMEMFLVLHCAINSEFSTTYLHQCFVVISQRWIHIASFFRLALAQIFGTEIHCYMRNTVLVSLCQARKERKHHGSTAFSREQLERFSQRYDELIALGYEANKKTRGKLAKKEEKALLNRLVKYKANHLLFLYDFRVHYSNNMSEKDLRICKNRDKMAGGFRSASGRDMYCRIMSFLETVKRRGMNIYQSIMALMKGRPVIQ